MTDREKVIKAWEAVLNRDPLDAPWDLIDDTLTLLKKHEKLLAKACKTLADMDFEFFCDDLMCDDGWCEEHCYCHGTKPECIMIWLEKQVEKGGD